MQKGIFVKDMAAPNEAEGVFVITLAAQGSSRNGPYWRLVLADASGSVEAKIWSPLSASFPALHTGSFFYAHGRVSTFRDQLQFTVEEGRLLGHLEICVEMLAPYLEKSGLEPELQRHLKHLVLSHHGTLEFGAVRVPQTAEALVLHYADNIDAKMAQCRGLFAQLGEGESWTPYQATLGRAMHRCAQTPVEEKVEKKPRASRKSSGEDGMLSLL